MTVDYGMLRKIAAYMRKKDIEIIAKAGSGHPGGSLSIIDLLAVLYFGKVMKYDSKNPKWPDRDRLVLSKGHTCPALYIALAYAGFFPKEELMNLRKFGSIIQGHPDLNMNTPGIENSSGPLGQGLSVALGMAIASMIDGRKNKVYTIIGDGETAKGSITEAAKLAGVLQMNNMVNFLDYNKVDQDGYVKDVMPCQFVQEWQSYGWATIQVDGNDIEKLHIAIQEAHKIQEDQSLPVMIIMDTVKGAGVSFMAEAARGGSGAWHGVAPKGEYLINAIRECDETITDLEADILGDIDAYIQSIQLTLEEKEKFSVAVEQKIDSKPSIITFTEPKATRDGFGKYLLELGKADSRIVAVTAGVAGSVRMDWFEKKFGKFNSVNRAGRFINVGIAEANMAGVAAGLALAGKKPWFATFDIFITECLSVIRNSICYNNVDVKIIGTHAGLGVEWDGGSHQSCIIPGFMNDLFRMQCYEPADSNETQEIMKKVYTDNKAAYLRLTRQNMPLLASQIIKQGEGARVVRINENPRAVLVGMGVGVHIAMDAAKVLLSQGIDVKVINAFSLSNLDNDNFRSMIPNVPVVCFHDAHYKILAKEVAYVLGRKVVGIGMKDFGESGDAASLYKKHGMDVESVVSRVKGLI